MTAHTQQTPDEFAAGYASAMRLRWTQPVGVAIRRMTARVLPGTPPEAIIGFTTESGSGPHAASDDTATDGSHNSFHEVGYFQTEAGLATGPAPNPDPGAQYNNWGRLASDPSVVAILGRAATMVPGGWTTAIDDQVAVGLVSLRAHARGTAAHLPASIRPSADGTLWSIVLAFMGFGAGDGGAAHTINRYAAQLASVDEPFRFGALIDAVLADAAHGHLPGTPGHHGNPAFDVLRVWHKLATGKMLAQSTGGDVSWFDTGLGSDEPSAQAGIVAAAFRSSGGGGGGGGGGGPLLVTGLVGGALAGAYRWLTGEWPWEHWS